MRPLLLISLLVTVVSACSAEKDSAPGLVSANTTENTTDTFDAEVPGNREVMVQRYTTLVYPSADNKELITSILSVFPPEKFLIKYVSRKRLYRDENDNPVESLAVAVLTKGSFGGGHKFRHRTEFYTGKKLHVNTSCGFLRIQNHEERTIEPTTSVAGPIMLHGGVIILEDYQSKAQGSVDIQDPGSPGKLEVTVTPAHKLSKLFESYGFESVESFFLAESIDESGEL